MSKIPQVENANSVATRYKMKAARIMEMAAPNSESINLKGGTKSIFQNSEPIVPSKNSPTDAAIKTVINAKATFWV